MRVPAAPAPPLSVPTTAGFNAYLPIDFHFVLPPVSQPHPSQYKGNHRREHGPYRFVGNAPTVSPVFSLSAAIVASASLSRTDSSVNLSLIA